jgi:hypothetical protein
MHHDMHQLLISSLARKRLLCEMRLSRRISASASLYVHVEDFVHFSLQLFRRLGPLREERVVQQVKQPTPP